MDVRSNAEFSQSMIKFENIERVPSARYDIQHNSTSNVLALLTSQDISTTFSNETYNLEQTKTSIVAKPFISTLSLVRESGSSGLKKG